MMSTYVLWGVAVLVMAYLVAAYARSQGYFFVRTFVLCVMAFSALVIMFYNFIYNN